MNESQRDSAHGKGLGKVPDTDKVKASVKPGGDCNSLGVSS